MTIHSFDHRKDEKQRNHIYKKTGTNTWKMINWWLKMQEQISLYTVLPVVHMHQKDNLFLLAIQNARKDGGITTGMKDFTNIKNPTER